jgi:hypothetical protein
MPASIALLDDSKVHCDVSLGLNVELLRLKIPFDYHKTNDSFQ